MLSAVTTSLLVCVVKLFIWYVAVMLSMCVWDPDGTHTHRQHYSHIPNKRGKHAEKVVTALSTKDDPLKMVKQL